MKMGTGVGVGMGVLVMLETLGYVCVRVVVAVVAG